MTGDPPRPLPAARLSRIVDVFNVTRDGGLTPPALMTPREAAAALALGQTKVYELLATGALPSIKIGAARRIPREALETFIATRLTDEAR